MKKAKISFDESSCIDPIDLPPSCSVAHLFIELPAELHRQLDMKIINVKQFSGEKHEIDFNKIEPAMS